MKKAFVSALLISLILSGCGSAAQSDAAHSENANTESVIVESVASESLPSNSTKEKEEATDYKDHISDSEITITTDGFSVPVPSNWAMNDKRKFGLLYIEKGDSTAFFQCVSDRYSDQLFDQKSNSEIADEYISGIGVSDYTITSCEDIEIAGYPAIKFRYKGTLDQYSVESAVALVLNHSSQLSRTIFELMQTDNCKKNHFDDFDAVLNGVTEIPKDERSSEPDMTESQRAAYFKALDYLKYSSFSKKGLIEQLEYEGFSEEDSEFAAGMALKWDEPDADGITGGQRQALGSAKSYLEHSNFSYTGLIEQLEYEGFSTEDATYAADNCGADWNEQAAGKAKSYLQHSSFDRQGLISQLTYEGFTSDQAEYGASAAGL